MVSVNKVLPIRIAGILETVNVTKKMKWDNSTEKYVEDNENGKYEIRLLVDKNDMMYGTKPKEMVEAFNKLNNIDIPLGGKIIGRKELFNTIKDGDDKEQFIKWKEIYTNKWVITLKNNYEINLFNTDGVKLNNLRDKELAERILEEQFYRGVTGLIIGQLYTNEKKEGIYGSVKAIRIVKLTERLGGGIIDEFELTEEELMYFMDEDI